MSLEIRTDKIVSVFALGQWHKVKKGSFCIDAYELVDYPYGLEHEGHQHWYILGEAYPKFSVAYNPRIPGSIGENWTTFNPSGSCGCQWIDEPTGETVSLCILEIKAWRQIRNEESV